MSPNVEWVAEAVGVLLRVLSQARIIWEGGISTRKYPHQTGPWASLWGILLIADGSGSAQPTVSEWRYPWQVLGSGISKKAN